MNRKQLLKGSCFFNCKEFVYFERKAVPALEKISLGSEDGRLSWDDVEAVNDACPKAVLDYRFTLYGNNSGGELKVSSPKLTEYKGKGIRGSRKADKKDGGKFRFSPGFCSPGTAYTVEKGCGGYIILSRSAQFAGPVKLKVSLPRK